MARGSQLPEPMCKYVIVAWTIVLLPGRAAACWDGWRAEIERVAFTGPDDVWSAARAREVGTWALRLAALVGPGGSVDAEMGWGSACSAGRCEQIEARSAGPADLFHAVATLLAIPRSRRAEVLGLTAHPYGVQVAASRDAAGAARLAERLSELELPVGFYEAGGFPADNPVVHVVSGVDAHGAAVHRVVVGTFIDRRQAAASAAEIAALTGLPTLLREL